MEVTTENFDAVLPEVVAAIKRSTFVAIDTELTGLTKEPWMSSSPIDSLDSRFAKSRQAAQSVGLVQFGVATFEYDAHSGAFLSRPYSFHLLPRVSNVGSDSGDAGYGGDAHFVASGAALSFLSEHGFDFNTLMARGVPFLSRAAEKQIRHQRRLEVIRKFLRSTGDEEEDTPKPAASAAADGSAGAAEADKPAPRVIVAPPGGVAATLAAVSGGGAAPGANPEDVMLTRDRDIAYYQDLVQRLNTWREKVKQWESRGRTAAAAAELQLEVEEFHDAQKAGADDDASMVDAVSEPFLFPYLVIPPVNGFLRHATHVQLESQFGRGAAALVFATTRASDQHGEGVNDWNKRLRVTWVGSMRDTFQRLELQRALREVDALITRAVGFRHVVDAITEARVPVVGHNCLLDLLHSSAKFSGPIPLSLCDWAAQLATLFPTVYDTKHLLSLPPDVGPDAAVSVAFNGKTGLGQAFEVVNNSVTVQIEDKAATAAAAAAAAAAASATAEAAAAAAPAAAPAAAADGAAKPGEWQTQKRGGNGGAAGGAGGQRKRKWGADPDAPAPVMREVTIDFPALVPVRLAPGFSYSAAPAAPAAATSGAAAASGPIPGGSMVALSPPAVEAVVAEDFAHDAGFDAHMTGTVFVRVAAQVARSSMPATEAPLTLEALNKLLRNPVLQPASMRQLANTLFIMRVSDWRLRRMSLDDARALSIAGRSTATKPREGEAADASNSVLVARAATDRSKVIVVSGLEYGTRPRDIAAVCARGVGIEPRLVDARKCIVEQGHDSVFVTLPTASHVDEALRVASLRGRKPSEVAARRAAAAAAREAAVKADEEAASSAGMLGGFLSTVVRTFSGGDNMLGVGSPRAGAGFDEDEAGDGSSEDSDGEGNKVPPPMELPDLSTMDVSQLTPALARSLQTATHLSQYKVCSYREWLHARPDVFGSTCDHECEPRVYLRPEQPAADAGAAKAAESGGEQGPPKRARVAGNEGGGGDCAVM